MLRTFLVGLMLAAGLLAACAPDTSDTVLVTNHAQVSTQMADLRLTSTVDAARLRTTLDYAQTRVALVSTQSRLLKATLVERGTPLAVLEEYAQQVRDGAIVLPTPPPRANPARQSNPAPSTPFRPVSSVDPDAPRLDNVVMARGVGNDDCAVDVTSEFSTADEEIYVVARAYQITAGTVFSSRWLLRGEEVISYEFTADNDFNDRCIWFFTDQIDIDFTPGEWSVVLSINGEQAASPESFTIVEVQDDMSG